MLPRGAAQRGRLAALDVDEGAPVRRGQVLARIESTDLDQTVQEMPAREHWRASSTSAPATWWTQKFVAPAELDRTRTELEAAQAALRRAQAQRDYNQLVAPADGIVLRRDGEIGQFIPAGQAVFTLACCAPLRVTAEVDEEDIAARAVGQKVVLRADALPGALFDGEVAEITPKGDPVARSYRVRIALPMPAVERAAAHRHDDGRQPDRRAARRCAARAQPRAARATWSGSCETAGCTPRTVKKGVAGAEPHRDRRRACRTASTVVLSPPDGPARGPACTRAAAPSPSAASAAVTPWRSRSTSRWRT